MGSSFPTAPRQASAEFLAVFRARADATGTMTFAQFMALALYHPDVGYYHSPRQRVGREPGTDFYTASSSGPIFGELVAAACVNLLQDCNAREFTFVEIGAETPGGVLAGVAHPFRAARVIQLGAPLDFPPQCVVFSNELFDAQPFQRFVFRAGAWRELGVKLEDNFCVEAELGIATLASLPSRAPEGYILDAPVRAGALAREIVASCWSGLFVACDYGKSWQELIDGAPGGTARAYFRHTQSNDLLARPGEQDLTCHVCWDWLAEAVTAAGFARPHVQSQEAFFVHHAADTLAHISKAEAARFSARKQALIQLLHPTHLGQKFQVLHARRTAPSPV